MHTHGKVLANHEGSESREDRNEDNNLAGKEAEQLERGLSHLEPMEGTDAYREREMQEMMNGLEED